MIVNNSMAGNSMSKSIPSSGDTNCNYAKFYKMPNSKKTNRFNIRMKSYLKVTFLSLSTCVRIAAMLLH